MNTTKPIPRYSHPPLIGAYSYKMTPLLSVTPSKRSNAKPPSLLKTHIQSQKENSNSFSNINKQINTTKTYVKESHKLLFSNKDKDKSTCTSGNSNSNSNTQAMMMMTHPIYTKRKNVKVKNRKISSNDVKSMITLNKNEEYSITCENNNNNNKDDGNNHISTYMKNVALQQSYVKKRPNNRSFIRMSSTCVGNNNVSSYFSNNNNNNNNNVHFMHYFDRDCNNSNHNSVINNSSNISFINHHHHAINTSHLGNYNTNNNITKLQPHQHTYTHNNNNNNNTHHHHHTTHIPTYIPSSTSNDDISEYFVYSDEKDHELTKDEKEIYGTREMKGYQKLKLLGKGGCGIVWLCLDKTTNTECAVKQISKKTQSTYLTSSSISIAKNEISILTYLTSASQTTPHPSKPSNIVHIYKSHEDKNDIWFAFEKGGKSLSSLSFKLKGSFIKSERIYTIQKGEFIKHLFPQHTTSHFKQLIVQLLHALQFIHSNGIIHADIKPENILIEYTTQPSFAITSVKVIDFGSAFYAAKPRNVNSNTPEYLCPEFTEINVVEGKKKCNVLTQLWKYPSCVDMWSLGVTLLELVVMCPVWMSYKAKVIINGKSIMIGAGLFGFKGRDGKKIHQKQIEVVANLKNIINKSIMSKYSVSDKDKFTDLLSKMLNINYKQRITPLDALKHPFLKLSSNSSSSNNTNNNKYC